MIAIDLGFNEFLLIWGVYGMTILLCIGIGFAWGYSLKEKQK